MCNTKHRLFKALHHKRRLDHDQNEGDWAKDSRSTLDVQNEGRLKIVIKTREIRPRILIIHSMFKTREESDQRVVSMIDLILHSNTNITEA